MESKKPSIYILYSEFLDRFYIGQTLDLELRIEQHIRKLYPGSFTSKASDWIVFLIVECESKKQAMEIESHIKRMKSRKYILDLKSYPSILEKLKVLYSK